VPIGSLVPEALNTFVYRPGFAGGPGGPGGPAAPGAGVGWEVHVIKAPAYNQELAVIPWRMVTGLQFVKQMNDLGSGTITLSQDDPFWTTVGLPDGSAAHELLDYENLWQVWQDGVIRFEFFGETITEQLVDPSEQRVATVTGPGTMAALKWGAAMPTGFPDIIYKLDAISDGFDEINSLGQLVLDTALWNASSGSGITLNPEGSAQVMGSAGGTILGTTAYDATGTLISGQVAPIVSPDANGNTLNGTQLTQFYIQSTASSSYYAMIALSASSFYCQVGDPQGVFTKVIASHTAFVNMQAGNQNWSYWQISESGGTFFFWTSPDAQNWTLQWQFNHTWNATSVGFYFSAAYSVANAEFATLTSINSNVTTSSLNGAFYLGQPIMATYLDLLQAAQARGTIPFVTTIMSPGADSFGNPWIDSESVQIANGTDLYTLLQAHTAMVNASFVMQPGFQLQVGLPEPGAVTLGVDRSKQVVFHESSDEQAKQRMRVRDSIANLIGVVNADGRTVTADNTSSVALWGQREAWLQAAMQVTQADITVVADASIEQTGSEVLSWTFQIAPGVRGRRIFYDFNVADWVGLERPDFTAIDAVQVQAIGVNIDQDGAETHELTVVSYLQFIQEQLQYIVTKMGGGFVNSTGTTAVATNGQSSTATQPNVFSIGLNQLIAGGANGTAPLVFNPVTGLWVPAGSTDPVSQTAVGLSVATPTASVTIAPTASTVTVTNNATGATTTSGIQADGTTTSVDAGGAAPAAPTTPVVVSAPGGLIVAWDGNLGGAPPLSDFKYVQVHVSTSSGFTPTPSTLQGTMIVGGAYSVGGLAVGGTYYVKLLAANTSNVFSVASSQATGVPSTVTASMLGPLGVLNANPYFLGGDGATWNGFDGTFSVTGSPPGASPYANAGLFTITTAGAGAAAEESGQPFAVVAGQPYFVTAWVYTPTTSAVIGFDWQNSSHAYLSTSTQTIVVTANTWTSVSTVLTAPAGAAYAYARLAPTDGLGNVIYIEAVLVLPQVPGGLIQAGTITVTQLAAGIVYAGIVNATTVTGATLQNSATDPRTSINPDGSISITNASSIVIFRIGPDGTVYWYNSTGALLQEIMPGGTQLIYESLTGPYNDSFEPTLPVLVVNATSVVSATSYTTTVAAAVPQGSVVTVAASCNGATAATAASDSQGNTYTLLQTQATTTPYQQVFQCASTATALGATDTITVTYGAANTSAKCIVASFLPGMAASPVDYSAQATGTSTAPSVSGTPTAYGDTVLMVVTDASTSGPSAVPDGWLLVGQVSAASGQTTSIYYSTNLASSGAFAASATLGSSVAWTAVTIGYLASPAQPFTPWAPVMTNAAATPSNLWTDQGNFSCKVTKVGTGSTWGIQFPPFAVQAGSPVNMRVIVGTANGAVALPLANWGYTFYSGPNGTGTNLGSQSWGGYNLAINTYWILTYSGTVPAGAVSAVAWVTEGQADTAGNYFLCDNLDIPGGLVYSNSPVAGVDSVGNVVPQGVNFLGVPNLTNVFSVTDPYKGTQLMSIDSAGDITGQVLTAGNDVVLGGQSLLNSVLPQYSQGLVAYGYTTTAPPFPATAIGTGETAIAEIDQQLQAGRVYRISVPATIIDGSTGRFIQSIRFTSDGSTPSTSSTLLTASTTQVSTASAFCGSPPLEAYVTPASTATYRFLLTAYLAAGGTTQYEAAVWVAIEDMGPSVDSTSNNLKYIGTGTTGLTGTQNYTQTFYIANGYTYKGNLSLYGRGSLYQGYTSWGGSMYSFMDFSAVGSTIPAGSTILSASLRLYCLSCYYSAGMTVAVYASNLLNNLSAGHILSTTPSTQYTIKGGQVAATSSGVPSLVSAGLMAGYNYLVLACNPIGGNSEQYAGYFYGANGSNSLMPALTVTWNH
jgi:hypothetical protein